MFPMAARPTRLCHKRSPVKCLVTASSMMVPRMTAAVAVHKTRSDLLRLCGSLEQEWLLMSVGAPGMTKDNLWSQYGPGLRPWLETDALLRHLQQE